MGMAEYFALLFLGFSVFTSIFCYAVLKDKTPNADGQCLPISLSPMMSKYSFLKIRNNEAKPKSIVSRLFKGEESQNQEIPILSYSIERDTLFYEKMVHWQSAKSIEGIVPNISSRNYHIESRTFLFGTDRFGRSLLSRILVGMRYSLFIGFTAVSLSFIIGMAIGLCAGYFGGWVDIFLSYIMNIVWSLPTVLFIFAIILAFGKSLGVLILAIALTIWVDLARIVRSMCKSQKETLYIQATKVMGLSLPNIWRHHLIPNILGTVWVISSTNFATAILIEAGLGYLGLGIAPPTPTLGNILNENFTFALAGKLNLMLIPSFFIICLVLSFNILSEYLKKSLSA